MYHNNTSKKELARRTLVYATMTLSVIALLLILLNQMFGYRFNADTLKIEQESLVQYDSYPRGALVVIDGVNFHNTRTKGIIKPGQHQFSMKLDGYETWQKTLNIEAGTVTHLNYARLVPAKRVVSDVAELPNVQSVKFAPGGQYLVGVGMIDGKPRVVWGDLRSADNVKLVESEIGAAQFAKYDVVDVEHSLTIEEWDSAGRFVLVKHNYAENGTTTSQWLRFDRENPNAIVDVSAIADTALLDMQFIGSGGNEVYALQSNGSLRQININNASLSRPILSNVTSFELYGNDTIAYTGSEAEAVVAGIWRKGWKTPRVVHRQAGGGPQIKASRYFNEDTVVLAVGNTATVYRGDLSDSDQAFSNLINSGKKFSLGRQIGQISLSSNGRMVVAKDDGGFISYDIERASVSSNIPLYGSAIGWLDDFHIWHYGQNGQLIMQEFDGANANSLLSAKVGFEASLSSNGEYLYAIGSSDRGLVLRRLTMRIK